MTDYCQERLEVFGMNKTEDKDKSEHAYKHCTQYGQR